VRVKKTAEGIQYLKEKGYPGNPVDEGGYLVITGRGMALDKLVFSSSGMKTTMYMIRDKKTGHGSGCRRVFASR
jgi:hypothetical protein